MRKVLLVALTVLVAATLALPASAGPSGQARTGAAAQPSGQLQSANGEYVVAYADGASAAAARAAIKAAGGTVVKENTQVGVATVKSSNPSFIAAAGRQSALVGAARNRPIGKLPSGAAPKDDVERLTAAERAAAKRPASTNGHAPGQEPLADKQWDMRMIDATPSGSYRVNQGRRGVMVGIIDTGVDGNHPDIKPNFNRAAQPQLHHRHPADRRALRAGPVLRRPGGRGRGRPRHPRGRAGRGRPSTGSALPASRPRSPWSTSGPGRTPGSSSCSRRWTRSCTPGWSGSTSST